MVGPYLYYAQGEEWVRITADAYEQNSSISGGQCTEVTYDVVITVTSTNTRNGTRTETRGFRYDGPIELITLYIDRPRPSNATWYTNVIIKAGRAYFNDGSFANGTLVRAGYTYVRESDGRTFADPDYQAWIFNNAFFSDPPTATIDNVQIIPRDGAVDDCGDGGCTTTFFLNGDPVLTLDDCPEVTNGRNDCADCCAQLLPIARAIRV